MVRLGFSEYEARAYVSLLEEHPATAYDAARRSGIPTSKIYEVLSRLRQKEVVYAVHEGKKKRYIPVDVDEFAASYARTVQHSLNTIRRESRDISAAENVSCIVSLTDYAAIMERAATIIKSAEKTLLASGWDNELSRFAKIIREAAAKSAVVHFGKTDVAYGLCYIHPVEELLRNEKGGRQLVIAVDGREALSATMHPDGSVDGVWSRSGGFASMAEDYIRHDIYILKTVQWLDGPMKRTFGGEYELLRDIFSNEVAR
ncbi:MAG: TrmB family transcriptional regulator [Spirochaetota bacterium]